MQLPITAEPASISTDIKIDVERLDVYYGAFHAIKNASLECRQIA